MQEQKAKLEKVPEQVILFEIRNVVERMQRLNNSLTKTENDVESYFKSMRKDANAVMDAQLEAEEARLRGMAQMQQLSYKNTLQEKSREEKENTMQEMVHPMSANMSEENIAHKKEDKAKITLERKAKIQQDPKT